MKSSAPAEVSAEFCGSGAPLTMKLEPGSDSNAALSEGSLTKSCAQASLRAQNERHDGDQLWIVEAGTKLGAQSVAFIAA